MNLMGIGEVLREIKVDDDLVKTCVLMSIETPNSSQVKAIASALQGDNIQYVGSINNRLTSIAFMIPLIQSMLKIQNDRRIQFSCCVICHDYGKSAFIAHLIDNLVGRSGIRFAAITRDKDVGCIQEVVNGPHIFVSSLKELTEYLRIEKTKKFDDLVTILVFHEPEKFEEQYMKTLNDELLDKLEKRKEKIQTFFFCNEKTRKVEELAKRFEREPCEWIEVDDAAGFGSPLIDKMEFLKYVIRGKLSTSLKVKHLIHIITSSASKCVIFADSCAKASALTSILTATLLDYEVFEFDRKKTKREKGVMLNDFGEHQDFNAILVCSDLAMEGFCIPIVGMYISYDIIAPLDFSFNRFSRATKVPDAGVPRRTVQLYHISESDGFYEILEHVFKQLDRKDKEFAEKRKGLGERVVEYPPPPSSEDLVEFIFDLEKDTRNLRNLRRIQRKR